jgi:hypothetical protein
VPLSGTGGSLPQGPPGTNGATGTTGATGATGAQGPPAKIELITCKTVPKTVNGKRRTHQKCTGRLVSGTVKFTTGTASARASIFRGRIIYATGASVAIGDGRTQLLLNDLRVLHPGRYTLTVRSRHQRHWIARRAMITIG